MKSYIVALLAVGATAMTHSAGYGMADRDIPERAHSDAVMASPKEVGKMQDWVRSVFQTAEKTEQVRSPKIILRRQDYDALGYGQSCVGTPLIIGKQEYHHGLGTHANSEILVKLPAGAKKFDAVVGVNNDLATASGKPSVEFSVEIGGTEVLHTPTLYGNSKAAAVSVDIPAGTDEIVLKVGATPDGQSWDHADWADARLTMQDGTVLWLDEGAGTGLLPESELPFSFKYGGVSSDELLKTWKKTVNIAKHEDAVEYRVEWRDSKTGLCITAVATALNQYPAVDWVVYFENMGSADTPIIEDIQTLDMKLSTVGKQKPAVLHRINGDQGGEGTFAPYDTRLDPGQVINMAPMGGRSSSHSAFPFFNFEYNNTGFIAAVGWTGQWSASFDRSNSGETRVRAGMELTHLLLHPGEKIRSPRILLMSWSGDIQRAHNQFRRMMLFHYMPKSNGRPPRLPISLQCWDRYWSRPGMASEEAQTAEAKFAHDIGCDTLWVDAAWFPPDFGSGVGNWYPKPNDFPNGLRPVSDVCHKLGMDFLVWFEPERVAANTQIATEHPNYVFGGEKGGLFKLNDPEARQWMTDLLVQRIKEYNIDVYRQDANIDPLGFWRQNDAPDRQGITEIRYIEGMYTMWDDLRKRCPGLIIDNCSSGGRRIDFETCMRSIPMWRSDTGCGSGHSSWNQSQSYGLGLYIPLHEVAGWAPEPYETRSAATAGALCQWGFREDGFPVDQAKAALAEVKLDQKYWYGDFYPITDCSIADNQFMAYQFHRADLNEGLILAFRRKECRNMGIIAALQGLDKSTTYTFEFIDDTYRKTVRKISGKEIASKGLDIRLPKPGSSLVIRYKPVAGN